MSKFKLKRVKVSSVLELRNWLAKNSTPEQRVMIVTCNGKSAEKHISSAKVRDALKGTGWIIEQNQELAGNPLGHVISKS